MYSGYRVFPGGKVWLTLSPHPLLVPTSKIEYSYTSTPPKGLRGLSKGETYLNLLAQPVGSRYTDYAIRPTPPV